MNILRPRLLRIDSADDAEALAELVAPAGADPTWRGWAAVLPPLDAASRDLFRGPAFQNRLLPIFGQRGDAMLGDLPALRWLGRSIASSPHPPAAQAGRQMACWVEAVQDAPPPASFRGQRFDWTRPLVVGIVNVTPDSFSDGGRFLDPQAAVRHGLRLAEEGADILDVGGESTRPRGLAYGAGAPLVTEAEEIARVVPVIRGLRAALATTPISVDTRKAGVAAAALAAGADLVNDVSGLLHDRRLAEVVGEREAGLILMHTPRDIEELSHEEQSGDIVGDVVEGLSQALERAAGIARERLFVDPGIGFGKTAANNLYLLRHLEAVRALGHPVLVGASRKASFGLAAAAGGPVPPPAERLGASVGAAVMAFCAGAHLLRVHDVRETVQALRVAAAIRGGRVQ